MPSVNVLTSVPNQFGAEYSKQKLSEEQLSEFVTRTVKVSRSSHMFPAEVMELYMTPDQAKDYDKMMHNIAEAGAAAREAAREAKDRRDKDHTGHSLGV